MQILQAVESYTSKDKYKNEKIRIQCELQNERKQNYSTHKQQLCISKNTYPFFLHDAHFLLYTNPIASRRTLYKHSAVYYFVLKVSNRHY